MPAAALMDELVEEVLLRIPPHNPECLVRASLVCKPWRRILADAAFRRRYREFQGTPPLLGFFQNHVRADDRFAVFVPTSGFRPPDLNQYEWPLLDCRHGRFLFASNLSSKGPLDLLVWEAMTGDGRRLPCSWAKHYHQCTAAVLCAAEGCDHGGCQGDGAFRVAFVGTQEVGYGVEVTSARLYSSETGTWSELTSVSVHRPCSHPIGGYRMPSLLVGDAIYFHDTTSYLIKYQLDTRRLSAIEPPTMYGKLMTAEDGGLGFASVDGTSLRLILWSRETSTEGVESWAQCRVIDLELLPDADGAFLNSGFASVCGYAEGTQAIFITTMFGVSMLELKSGRVRKVLESFHGEVFPYMSFCIQAMEAPPTGQGQ